VTGGSLRPVWLGASIVGLLAGAAVSAACARARSDSPEPSPEMVAKLMKEGETLSAGQWAALEEQLRRDPDDANARLRLISHYGRGGGEGATTGEPYESLVLGLIERRPRWRVSSEMFLGRGEGFEKGARLWLSLAAAHAQDGKVLGNAGSFLTMDVLNTKYRDRGKQLLSEARRLDPGEPRWPKALGEMAEEEIDRYAAAPAVRTQAAAALAYLEEAERLTREAPRGEQLYVALRPMANAAFLAGEHRKAVEYATRLLKAAAGQPRSWWCGNAIHEAYTILGRVAVREGRVEDAEKYLLDSARSEGSPQLSSFGPSMDLARELLARGRREVVLQYLDLCAGFWKLSGGRLEQWKSAIRAGRTPEGGEWLAPRP
jgi:tetratricopeptide (TPR) repeat protein